MGCSTQLSDRTGISMHMNAKHHTHWYPAQSTRSIVVTIYHHFLRIKASWIKLAVDGFFVEANCRHLEETISPVLVIKLKKKLKKATKKRR